MLSWIEIDKIKVKKIDTADNASGRHGKMYSFPVSHVFNSKNKFNFNFY